MKCIIILQLYELIKQIYFSNLLCFSKWIHMYILNCILIAFEIIRAWNFIPTFQMRRLRMRYKMTFWRIRGLLKRLKSKYYLLCYRYRNRNLWRWLRFGASNWWSWKPNLVFWLLDENLPSKPCCFWRWRACFWLLPPYDSANTQILFHENVVNFIKLSVASIH